MFKLLKGKISEEPPDEEAHNSNPMHLHLPPFFPTPFQNVAQGNPHIRRGAG